MSSIQTRGFEVSDRPVYSPIDPKLTTFDPQAIQEGILSAYKVANDVERFEAFKAQNDELNALRADREATAHAELQNRASSALSAMQIRPQETANTIYGNQTLAALQPGERTIKLADQGFAVETQPREISLRRDALTQREEMQPVQNEIALNNAQVDRAVADAKVADVDAIVATASDTTAYNASEAANKLQQQADQQKLAAQTLADQLANAKTDAERRRLSADLAIEIQKSQVAENLAKAAKDRAYAENGPPAGQSGQELRAYQTSEKDILERPLPSGVKMKVYLENLQRDPLMTPDPEGERLRTQLRGLRDAQGKVLESIAAHVDKRAQALAAAKAGPPVTVKFNPVGAVSTPAAQDVFDTPATGPDLSALTPVQTEAYNWAVNHPQDPRSAAILATLPVK